MSDQLAFVEALLKYQVVQFGDFVTKTGRISPYFFNSGNFCCSDSLAEVAALYAKALFAHFGSKARYLFGPAYKGIPLAVMVAHELSRLSGLRTFYTFNRKESKDHGEGGSLVGYAYQGGEELVIVEDVLTGGLSIRESCQLLAQHPVKVAGVIVGIDRQERGQGGSRSARAEIEQDYGIPVLSLITLRELMSILAERDILGKRWLGPAQKEKIQAYLQQYGA